MQVSCGKPSMHKAVAQSGVMPKQTNKQKQNKTYFKDQLVRVKQSVHLIKAEDHKSLNVNLK